MKILIIAGFNLLFIVASAQTERNFQKEVDSLNFIIGAGSTHDSTRTSALLSLTEVYFYYNTDSLGPVTDRAVKTIESILFNKFTYKERERILELYITALYNRGYIHSHMGNIPKAVKDIEKSLLISEKLKHTESIANNLNQLGFIKANIEGKPADALPYFLRTLEIAKLEKDTHDLLLSLNNLGYVYELQGNYKQSLDFLHQALTLASYPNNEPLQVSILGNIGSIHYSMGDLERSEEFQTKAMKICDEKKLHHQKGTVIMNLGMTYLTKEEPGKAIKLFEDALILSKERGEQYMVAACNKNLAEAYLAIGDNKTAMEYAEKSLQLSREAGYGEGSFSSLILLGKLTQEENLQKAEAYAQMAMKEGKASDSPDMIERSANLLHDIYTRAGRHEKALEYYKIHVETLDSISNASAKRDVIRKDMDFEFELREQATKMEQEKANLIASENLKRQKLQTYAFGSGGGLVLILSMVLLKGYRQKKKANGIILHQKLEVESQRNILEDKNKEILDSITYAKRIQNAILPPVRTIKNYLPNNFIFYKPKDIVAGDFYWMEKKNGVILFAVADCTGHGVPGALVSVVCHNALNRSVREFNLIDPGQILDKTREIILEEFGKSDDIVQDGMDISLCCLDVKNKKLIWAGANNPLWICSNKELIEIKPDKQPIGRYDKMLPFTSHSLELKEDDMIYIFSDGYADQFGGEKGKKFKSSNLKELLRSISSLPATDQHSMLEETFDNWKNNSEQVDDVCMIGVRI